MGIIHQFFLTEFFGYQDQKALSLTFCSNLNLIQFGGGQDKEIPYFSLF